MDIKRILKAIWFTPGRKGWGLPMLFWGRPGVAKTSVIESAAMEFGLPCEVLSPGERGEGAFGVTPVPQDGLIRYPPPEWASRFMTNAGLVFLDEANTAPPVLQAPLLGLLNERRIGGAYLGPRSRLVAAANDIQDAAGGWDLAPAIANRLGHMNWPVPTAQEWTAWMMGGARLQVEQTLDPKKEEDRVEDVFPSLLARATGETTSFLKKNVGQMHALPPPGNPQASKAWPSHRSWELATRALAASYTHQLDPNEQVALVQAYVGEAAAKMFFQFKATLDLPDPEEILDEKITFTHSKDHIDRTMVVLQSMAAVVAPKGAKHRERRAKVAWRILGEVSKDAADVAFHAACIMVTAGGIHAFTESFTALEIIGPMLKRAGIKYTGKR